MNTIILALVSKADGSAQKAVYVGADADDAIKKINAQLDNSRNAFEIGRAIRVHLHESVLFRRVVTPEEPRPEVLTPQQRAKLAAEEAEEAAKAEAAKKLLSLDPDQLADLGLVKVEELDIAGENVVDVIENAFEPSEDAGEATAAPSETSEDSEAAPATPSEPSEQPEPTSQTASETSETSAKS